MGAHAACTCCTRCCRCRGAGGAGEPLPGDGDQGPAQPVRDHTRQGQQGGHRVQHHVSVTAAPQRGFGRLQATCDLDSYAWHICGGLGQQLFWSSCDVISLVCSNIISKLSRLTSDCPGSSGHEHRVCDCLPAATALSVACACPNHRAKPGAWFAAGVRVAHAAFYAVPGFACICPAMMMHTLSLCCCWLHHMCLNAVPSPCTTPLLSPGAGTWWASTQSSCVHTGSSSRPSSTSCLSSCTRLTQACRCGAGRSCSALPQPLGCM